MRTVSQMGFSIFFSLASSSYMMWHTITVVFTCLESQQVAPGWLSQLSVCLELRSWSQGPGFKFCIGLPASPSHFACHSSCLCSLSNKIFIKKKNHQFTEKVSSGYNSEHLQQRSLSNKSSSGIFWKTSKYIFIDLLPNLKICKFGNFCVRGGFMKNYDRIEPVYAILKIEV